MDIHIYFHTPDLTRIEQKMAKIDDAITALTASVANLTTVDASAVALLNGLSAQLTQAIADLKAAGVTDAQLKSLTDLASVIDTQDTSLAEAVAANTAAPPAA